MVPRVLITHAGRQHSGESALALHEAGMLAGYWVGVPSLRHHRQRVPAWVWDYFIHYDLLDLPPSRVRCWPWSPVLRQLIRRLGLSSFTVAADLASCRLFDRWAAAGLGNLSADAVLGCEMAALATFRVAKARGMSVLLDAPSMHHQAQDALHGYTESRALHRYITSVKDREIELADAIITCSDLARDTYLAAGVPAEKVVAIPLGANLSLFVPEEGGGRRSGPLRFVFSGAMILRKGFDLVLSAFATLRQSMPDIELLIVGPSGDATRLLDRVGRNRVVVAGMLPQAELVKRLRTCDCLLLPSRNDSYGMVVPEALSCGIPAIVSTMVGAKTLISEGDTGWIVPVGNEEALLERMRWCADHPALVRGMRDACRKASENASWEAYHRQFSRTISKLAPGRRAR